MFTMHQRQAVQRRTTLLLATALLLGLVSSTLFGATGNADQMGAPNLLPVGVDESAAPMTDARVATFAADARLAIELQNAGNWKAAAGIWEQASAACEHEVWRQLGIGVARLYLQQLDLADQHFSAALELDTENPAVHYFVGLLRIEQALRAREYADSLLPTGTRLVEYVPVVEYVPGPLSSATGPGKSQSRLQLEAINALEMAISHASELDLGASLADITWVIPVPYPVTQPLAPPNVGELLGSFGADNFAVKAHGLLAELYLDHGRPDQAEYHIDEAGQLGMNVPDAYRRAGDLYEERGQSADAFRVYLKAMQQGDGIVTPGRKALRSLGSALEELF